MPSDPDFYNIAYTTAACPKCLGPEACRPGRWARDGLRHLTFGDALRCRRCETDYAYEFLRRVAGCEEPDHDSHKVGESDVLDTDARTVVDTIAYRVACRQVAKVTERLDKIESKMHDDLAPIEDSLDAHDASLKALRSSQRQTEEEVGDWRHQVNDWMDDIENRLGQVERVLDPVVSVDLDEYDLGELRRPGHVRRAVPPAIDPERVGDVRDYLTLEVFGPIGPLEGVRIRVFLLAFVQSLLLDTRGETLDGQRTTRNHLHDALDDLAKYVRESRHGPASATEYLNPEEESSDDS